MEKINLKRDLIEISMHGPAQHVARNCILMSQTLFNSLCPSFSHLGWVANLMTSENVPNSLKFMMTCIL